MKFLADLFLRFLNYLWRRHERAVLGRTFAVRGDGGEGREARDLSGTMTAEEHRQRHVELHKSLDELVADFIWLTGQVPSQTSLMDFMKWAYQQTISPTTEKPGDEHGQNR